MDKEFQTVEYQEYREAKQEKDKIILEKLKVANLNR